MAIYQMETNPGETTGEATDSPLSAHTDVSFVLVDPKLPDAPIVYASKAFEQETGYPVPEIMGKNCRFLQGKDTHQPGLIEVRQAIREKRSCRILLRNYKKDGSFFWNDFTLVPILDGYGELSLLLGVQHAVDKDGLLDKGMETPAVPLAQSEVVSSPSLGRLGEILVAHGVVSRTIAVAAVQMQQDGNKMRLGEILVAHFGVPQFAIVEALSVQIDDARAKNSQTDLLQKTAFAVRLAQTTMEAVPELDLPIVSISQPLSDAGGDTFYPLRLDDGSQLLLLADVAGHSVISSYAVAAFLGMCCAVSNQLLAGEVRGLRELFRRLNHCLQNGPFADVPISALAAHWDIRHGRLHIINAGMPHGFWFQRTEGVSKSIALSGNPLGILDEPYMEERVLALRPGERVIFGSDGLFETLSPDGVMFQDVASEHLDRLAGRSLGDAVATFCDLSRKHSGEKMTDDLLAVAIEQPPIVSEPFSLRLYLPSTLDAIDTACERLAEFLHSDPALAQQAHASEFMLMLAAREAMSNAVLHGNRGYACKGICFACVTEPPFSHLVMTVTDEGTGFDIVQHNAPADLQTSERGRGVPIMRATAKVADMIGGELQLEFDLGAQLDENFNDAN